MSYNYYTSMNLKKYTLVFSSDFRDQKPVRSGENWKRTIRKRLRNSGQKYRSTSGKVVAAKTCKPVQNHKCRLNCALKLTDEQRQQIFDGFWALETWSAQNAYICGLVEQRHVDRHYSAEGHASRRQFTRDFYLWSNEGSSRVCKTVFLATLGISNGRLSRTLNSQIHAGDATPAVDNRGRHAPANKTPADQIENVRQHIGSFPTYSSQENPNERFLSPTLSLGMMYRLYLKECDGSGREPVKQWCYRRVLLTDFNLSFHRPQTETRANRDAFKVKTEVATDEVDKASLAGQWELHSPYSRIFHQTEAATALSANK